MYFFNLKRVYLIGSHIKRSYWLQLICARDNCTGHFDFAVTQGNIYIGGN